MDEQCSRAVRYAFVELYNRKLLYRGKRLVNWCPRCSTALADIEVEHKRCEGLALAHPLSHRRAPQEAASGAEEEVPPTPSRRGYVVVATTRPETLLGDTAVAVNPEGQALQGTRRASTLTAAAHRPRDSHRRRRRRGQDLRFRRREGHARPRSDRL